MTQNEFVPDHILIPHFGKDAALIGIEIGVMTACGSVAMLDRLPNLMLCSIDPWKSFEGAQFEAGRDQAYHDENFEHAKQRLAGYGKRSIILRMTSDQAMLVAPGNVDFVFIDGHHEYSQVLKDIVNYLPKIRKGGIIAGHDYIQVPDVTWAVEKIFKKEDIHSGEDFTWWVYV